MELGKTVVLLNLESLYESLYDALNQFYYKFGDNEKFVDLGLGTQRVKCLVHNDFRLIVVADKKSVYNPKKYPIPLVNRLEKHLLNIESILNDKTKWMVNILNDWCKQVTSHSEKYSGYKNSSKKKDAYLKPSDIFIGFTEDTIPSLVFKLSKDVAELAHDNTEAEWKEQANAIMKQVESYLIQCATSDAIIRLLPLTYNQNINYDIDLNDIVQNYFVQQAHDNFNSFFQAHCAKNTLPHQFIQITTHSKLMSKKAIEKINLLNKAYVIKHESLLSFDTQQQFSQVLREFYENNLKEDMDEENKKSTPNVLIIQCDSSHFYQDLVNCARFTIIDEYSKCLNELEIKQTSGLNTNFMLFLILQIPKIKDGCISGFQTAKWHCYHIDDLQDEFLIGNVLNYQNKSVSELFSEGTLDSDQNSSVSEVNKKNNNFRMLKNILISVVYVSCSKVVESFNLLNNRAGHTRTIQRIEVLLNLLRTNEKFTNSLLRHIAKLQAERETTLSNPDLSKAWIFNEVSKLSNVIKYGTLKNSCRNYIEKRMNQLFAGLISFSDSYNNLDLLTRSDNKEWIVDFWLNIFNNEQLVDMSFSKYYYQPNSSNSEKSEFICLNNANLLENKLKDEKLQLKLPFSWLIKEHLDKIANLKIKESELLSSEREERMETDSILTDKSLERKNLYEQLVNAFDQSPLYANLNALLPSNETKKDAIQFYINDYLLLSLKEPLVNYNHFYLYKKRLLDHCKDNYCHNFFDFNMLIGVHLSYDDLQQELRLFSKFASLNNTIIDSMLKNDKNNTNMCYLASRLITKGYLEPNPTMKMNEWKEWFSRVEKSSMAIQNFINLYPELTSENNDESKEFKTLWRKVILLKYYIEHLCYNNDFLYDRCILLWNYFKESSDLKKNDPYSKLIKFLTLITKAVNPKFLKLKVQCESCGDKEFKYSCKVIKCKCEICNLCEEKLKQTKTCPKCLKQLGDVNLKTEKTKDSEYYIEYTKFKTSLNCFYMDIITNLCFDSIDNLPEKSVVDSIIEILLPKSKKANQNPEDGLDLNINPSIKSNLFQTLLKYNQNDVEEHLKKILNKAETFLKTNYQTNDIIQLKLIYINSIEDQLYSKGTTDNQIDNMNLDVKLGLNILHELSNLNDLSDEKNAILQLKIIAKIKFCLVTCAKLIFDLDLNDQAHIKFFDMIKNFIELNQNCLWFRFFLIKQIFRRHGKSQLINLTKLDLFEWIVPRDLLRNSADVS
jgi:hypothetical protein